MAYVKPQSPIKNGDDNIYPLTTYDQIIMSDNSRWDGDVGVKSVNRKTGNVTLTASDVGAATSEHTHNYPVTSVDGKTGAVTLDYPVTSVEGMTGDVTLDYPVDSVNEQTGAVNLTYSDVEAAAASHTHDSIMSPACLALTWSGDHMLSSTDRPNQKLHFGINTLYRYNSSNSVYYPIHDDGNLTFSLSGTTLTITKS